MEKVGKQKRSCPFDYHIAMTVLPDTFFAFRKTANDFLCPTLPLIYFLSENWNDCCSSPKLFGF